MHPQTDVHTRALLKHLKWELLDHPPYSPDLTPSEYHLFTYLKNWLGSQCFNNNEQLMEDVKMWLSSWAAELLTQAYKNLFPDMTSASILVVTMLRSSLSIHVYFVHNFSPVACFVNVSLEVTFQMALKKCVHFTNVSNLTAVICTDK
jgi:hypothetical protein